jgi:hypothetical protein
MTIAEGQGMSENLNFEIEPTQSKTDSSSCFGITSFGFIRAKEGIATSSSNDRPLKICFYFLHMI